MGTLILDFEKAFNTPPHELIKSKLFNCGIALSYASDNSEFNCCRKHLKAKIRSERDFEMSLCYTPKAFSFLKEIKYNISHCLELAPSFPKMYNITMF